MLRTPPLSRASFWLKVGLAAALAVLANILLFGHEPGSTLGVFALAWLAAVLLARPGLIRDRRALAAVAAAVGFALILIDRPGPLAWLLFGLSLAVAALSARIRPGEPAWRWAQRIVVEAVVAAFGPFLDLFRLSRLKRRQRLSALALLGRLIMPIVGGLVFLTLFAIANPLISDFIDSLALPAVSEEIIGRILFWGVVGIITFGALRPRWRRKLIDLPTRKLAAASSPSLTASITWSLVVFNAVFALQNGLDLAFLWSGAPLPDDMSLAEYAHRGAYPLIVTALLAGLFVLVALQPGSDTARRPLVRRLVVLWVAQNLLLVASSLLRTADYIEAYALTRFRIAAMIWMVLVGIGLLLILWRMLRDKSAHWLIDANVVVTLAVLAVVSAIDLGGFAAAWNVRHARDAGGEGVPLDLGYLRSLGSPALISLVELEQTADDPDLADRAAAVRQRILIDTRRRQGDWRSGWTWRDQRRLERVARMTRDRPLAQPRPGPRDADGRLRRPRIVITLPGPVAVPASPPLTSPAGV